MGNIRVHIEYDESKIDFEGPPEEVIKTFLDFICKVYPAYETIRNLTLTVDLEDLLRKLEGILGFALEGPVILIPKDKLSKISVREQLALQLVKAYIANQLRKAEKSSASVDELLRAVGGGIGAMAGRLSEMVSEELVDRIGRGEYQITTYGLKNFCEIILPKIKQISREVG